MAAFIYFAPIAAAQKPPSKKPSAANQVPEFQLGLKSGVNFTKVNPIQSYSIFESTNDQGGLDEKEYLNSRPGALIGFSAVFGLNRSLSLTISPAFSGIKFGYQSSYKWEDPEAPGNNTRLRLKHQHSLQYLDLPVSARYHLLTGRFKPYLEAGISYSILQSAYKEITTTRIDNATTENKIEVTDEQTIGIKNLFIKPYAGILAGAGIRYDLGNVASILDGNSNLGVVTLFLSGTYRNGLNNIANVRQRYTDSRPSLGAYDLLDDIKLKNIEVSMGCLFTLKYKTSK